MPLQPGWPAVPLHAEARFLVFELVEEEPHGGCAQSAALAAVDITAVRVAMSATTMVVAKAVSMASSTAVVRCG